MGAVENVPWTLSVGAAGRDGAEGEYRTILTSTDLAGAGNSALRIDLFANGQARILGHQSPEIKVGDKVLGC
jgi:hypothetical protein